jgi:type IV pilus assembly protein PilQ
MSLSNRISSPACLQLYRWLLVGLFCFSAAGCYAPFSKPKPSIKDLYEQAVHENAEKPENTFVPNETEVITQTEELPAAKGSLEDTVGTINEEFVETDIQEAIQIIATAANVEIIVDDKVRGVANISLTNATFENALEKLLLPLGLVYSHRDNRYYVGNPDPDSPLFLYLAEHFEYRPQHHTPNDLLPAIPEKLKRYTRVLEKAGSIAIDAPQPHANAVLDRLKQADQPVAQVILEAIVCVVSPDCGFRFGLDWNHAFQVDGKDAFSVGVNGLDLSAKMSPNGLHNAFDEFAVTSAFVKLLAENGYLAIRAAPRVMAKDGEKANISINRETFFSVQPISNTGEANNAIFFSQNIQKVDSGISLHITPVIRGENVTVNIEKAEVSEDVRTALADTGGNPYPTINRRSVATTVHVHDGKTIVIGGLMQKQMVDRVQYVPGLSKIPVVKRLFQNIQHQEREVEVVIFISPRIVRSQEKVEPTLISQPQVPHARRTF